MTAGARVCYTTTMNTLALPAAASATAAPAFSHVALVARMKAIVGNDNVLTAVADMAAYECDGFTIAKTKSNVDFPTATEHIVGIATACNELSASFLSRSRHPRGGCRRLPTPLPRAWGLLNQMNRPQVFAHSPFLLGNRSPSAKALSVADPSPSVSLER